MGDTWLDNWIEDYEKDPLFFHLVGLARAIQRDLEPMNPSDSDHTCKFSLAPIVDMSLRFVCECGNIIRAANHEDNWEVANKLAQQRGYKKVFWPEMLELEDLIQKVKETVVK